MTLKQLRDQLKAKLAELATRMGNGEDVIAELTNVNSALKNVNQQIVAKGEDATVDAPTAASTGTETPEQELARLRAAEQERAERAVAEAAARAAVQQLLADQSGAEERIRRFAAEEAVKALGGQATEDAVARILKEARGGSRFAAAGADESVIAALAAGGTVATAEGSGLDGIKVGDHAGVKRIRDSKNMAHFMGMILKQKEGGFRLNEAEKLFLQESQQKAMTEGTDSAGGFFVHPEWMPDILGLLRAQAVVRASGPRIVPFNKLMNQTSVSTGATAFYQLEGNNIQASQGSLAEAPLLTPKNLTGLVAVSNYLLSDAPEADAFVRGDLIEVISLREDLAFIQGSGAGGEPTGMKNFTGKTLDPLALGTNGAYLTQPQTRAIRNLTRTFNAQNPRFVWFWNPRFLNHLEGLTDADGRYLADTNILKINDDGRSGVYDGTPFWTTTQIPDNLTVGSSSNCSYMILCNVRELVIGDNATLELAVSTDASYTTDGGTTWRSAFQIGETLFRAVLRHDIAHRRPNQTIVQTGVRVP